MEREEGEETMDEGKIREKGEEEEVNCVDGYDDGATSMVFMNLPQPLDKPSLVKINF